MPFDRLNNAIRTQPERNPKHKQRLACALGCVQIVFRAQPHNQVVFVLDEGLECGVWVLWCRVQGQGQGVRFRVEGLKFGVRSVGLSFEG